MRSPVVALLWECWRMARRWYLWVLALAMFFQLYYLPQANDLPPNPGRGPALTLELLRLLQATPMMMASLALAAFASALAVPLGNKAGFPLGFAFRLPVATATLMAVPMLFTALLCALLYLAPTLLVRLVYGVPYPLLAPTAIIASFVVALLTSTWAPRSTPKRVAAYVATVASAVQGFRILDPYVEREPLTRPPVSNAEIFSADVFSLTVPEYAALVALCCGLFLYARHALAQQRSGDDAGHLFKAAGTEAGTTVPAAAAPQPAQVSLLSRIEERFAFPCTARTPWQAELWLELRLNVVPLMFFNVLMALFIPVLLLVAIPVSGRLGPLDYIFPLAVLITGVGYGIFKRRAPSDGYMSAFEGTRGMATISLALIQLLAICAASLCGIVFVSVSLYFWSPELDVQGDFGNQLQTLPALLGEFSALRILSEFVMLLVLHASAVALFASISACSVFWGRFVPYATGGIVIYGLIFTSGVSNNRVRPEIIGDHIWGFALVVLMITVLALGRTLQLKLLSLRAGLITLLCWGVFLACAAFALSQRDIDLAYQPAALQALYAAVLLAPVTLFIVYIWSQDGLRHR